MSLRTCVSLLTISLASLTLVSCIELEDDDEFDNLRPAKVTCANCHVNDFIATLSLSTDYNPADLVNVTIHIANRYGNETLNYGASVSVPNDPDTVAVTDTELCTVGSTGLPPHSATVTFDFYDGTRSFSVSDSLPIFSNCS